MQLPPGLIPHLPKINFATLALAAVVFFFPWTELSCGGRDAGTQSGFQAIYAGFSEADWIKQDKVTKTDPDTGEKKDPESDLGIGLIAALAFLATVGGAVVAGLFLFKGVPPAINPASLAVVALVLLLFQSVIGFPIDRAAKKAMKDVDTPTNMPPAQNEMERQMQREMQRSMASAISIKTERMGWFYFELLLLAIPAGLLIYSMLPDKATPTASTATMAGAVPPFAAAGGTPSIPSPPPPVSEPPPTPPAS